MDDENDSKRDSGSNLAHSKPTRNNTSQLGVKSAGAAPTNAVKRAQSKPAAKKKSPTMVTVPT